MIFFDVNLRVNVSEQINGLSLSFKSRIEMCIHIYIYIYNLKIKQLQTGES